MRVCRALARVAVPIGERVELLHVAELEARLLAHPGPQAELERPVAGGVEGPKGRAGSCAPGPAIPWSERPTVSAAPRR